MAFKIISEKDDVPLIQIGAFDPITKKTEAEKEWIKELGASTEPLKEGVPVVPSEVKELEREIVFRIKESPLTNNVEYRIKPEDLSYLKALLERINVKNT